MGVPMSRQRDIFPLPLPFADSSPRAPLSRQVRRRLLRKCHWQAWANEGVAALNQLYGSGQSPGEGLGDIHAKCIDHISEPYRTLPPPPPDMNSEGALCALLGSSAVACSPPPVTTRLASHGLRWAQNRSPWFNASLKPTVNCCCLGAPLC